MKALSILPLRALRLEWFDRFGVEGGRSWFWCFVQSIVVVLRNIKLSYGLSVEDT